MRVYDSICVCNKLLNSTIISLIIPFFYRDYNLQPLIYEVTPLSQVQMNTVLAYVKKDAMLDKMADLRGKRVYFPNYDGVAWHSVLNYIRNTEYLHCFEIIHGYFSEICAPGVEKLNITVNMIEEYSRNCYFEDGKVLGGELAALRALVEGRVDVAFVSLKTVSMYESKYILI